MPALSAASLRIRPFASRKVAEGVRFFPQEQTQLVELRTNRMNVSAVRFFVEDVEQIERVL